MGQNYTQLLIGTQKITLFVLFQCSSLAFKPPVPLMAEITWEKYVSWQSNVTLFWAITESFCFLPQFPSVLLFDFSPTRQRSYERSLSIPLTFGLAPAFHAVEGGWHKPLYVPRWEGKINPVLDSPTLRTNQGGLEGCEEEFEFLSWMGSWRWTVNESFPGREKNGLAIKAREEIPS